jgi:hypothetical protein
MLRKCGNHQWAFAMREETYIEALRNSLMAFRSAATEFGKVESRIDEARSRKDTEKLQQLEEVWEKYAADRLGIALALFQTMNLFTQAGARIPNSRWKTPPWVYREWKRVLFEGLD